MLNRLVGICFAMLAAAVAIYVAVRLIESFATTLIVIMAVIGGFVVVGFVARLLWRRQRMDRW
jgi:uncharacterized membrane protein